VTCLPYRIVCPYGLNVAVHMQKDIHTDSRSKSAIVGNTVESTAIALEIIINEMWFIIISNLIHLNKYVSA